MIPFCPVETWLILRKEIIKLKTVYFMLSLLLVTVIPYYNFYTNILKLNKGKSLKKWYKIHRTVQSVFYLIEIASYKQQNFQVLLLLENSKFNNVSVGCSRSI